MSSAPPFKLAPAVAYSSPAEPMNPLLVDALSRGPGHGPDVVDDNGEVQSGGRGKLSALPPYLYCSVIGTCLTTEELRKVMRRYVDVAGESDATLHHDAVGSVDERAVVGKAINKALDRRHEAVVRRFDQIRDVVELKAAWGEALSQGEIPGAYWAVLTHRLVTAELQKQVFGDVHMLSHLVGAANRADIRRLMALQRENEELRDQLERQHGRSVALLRERDSALQSVRDRVERTAQALTVETQARAPGPDPAQLIAQVEVQTARRERAENESARLAAELARVQSELDEFGKHAAALANELQAAESRLLQIAEPSKVSSLALALAGQRLLYVGGRPSTTAAIRDVVESSGGEFRKHDGGIEDRKGLLDGAVAWSSLVVFPVDCVDHDSALRLKRTCVRMNIRFAALRSASVASFAAGVVTTPGESGDGIRICRRHG